MYVFSNQEGNSGKTGNKEDSFLKWKINVHIEFTIAWKEILGFKVWLSASSGQSSHYPYKMLEFPNLFSTPVANTTVYHMIIHSPLYPCLQQ